jgi:hypothetical protein
VAGVSVRSDCCIAVVSAIASFVVCVSNMVVPPCELGGPDFRRISDCWTAVCSVRHSSRESNNSVYTSTTTNSQKRLPSAFKWQNSYKVKVPGLQPISNNEEHGNREVDPAVCVACLTAWKLPSRKSSQGQSTARSKSARSTSSRESCQCYLKHTQ